MVKQSQQDKGHTPVKKIPVCPDCQRKTIYFRADGSIKCRSCGYDGVLKNGS